MHYFYARRPKITSCTRKKKEGLGCSQVVHHAEVFFHRREDDVGVGPLHVGHGEQALREHAQIAPALELGDHYGVGLPGDVVNRADVGDLGDLLVCLQELPLGDNDLRDHGELVAQPLVVEADRVVLYDPSGLQPLHVVDHRCGRDPDGLR